MKQYLSEYSLLVFIVLLFCTNENNNIYAQVKLQNTAYEQDTLFVEGPKNVLEYMRRKEAREDIESGNIFIIVPGMPFASKETDSLANEYGFRFFYQGCVPREGNNYYNDEVKKYLSQKNGEGWWKKFKKEEAGIRE